MKKLILFLSTLTVIFCCSFVWAANSSTAEGKTITSIVTPNQSSARSGPSVTVVADIAENIPVIKIELFYRAIGASNFDSVIMHADKNGEYRYIINKSELDYPGIEYYIVAFDLVGNSLLHGNVNLPLIANFSDGWGSTKIVKNSGLQSSVNRIIVRDEWLNKPDNANGPLWKNKWLWIGISVIAAAALTNDDEGSNAPSKPAFSIVIEGSQPEPAVP